VETPGMMLGWNMLGEKEYLMVKKSARRTRRTTTRHSRHA